MCLGGCWPHLVGTVGRVPLGILGGLMQIALGFSAEFSENVCKLLWGLGYFLGAFLGDFVGGGSLVELWPSAWGLSSPMGAKARLGPRRSPWRQPLGGLPRTAFAKSLGGAWTKYGNIVGRLP